MSQLAWSMSMSVLAPGPWSVRLSVSHSEKFVAHSTYDSVRSEHVGKDQATLSRAGKGGLSKKGSALHLPRKKNDYKCQAAGR